MAEGLPVGERRGCSVLQYEDPSKDKNFRVTPSTDRTE